MKVKNAIKKSLCAAGIAVLAFLLCSVLLFALMQTDGGRKETAHIIGRVLSEGDQSRVVINGLKGRFPFHFHVGQISWSDSDGPWLVAQGITVHWSPWDLLNGMIRIKVLHASTLNIERAPQQKAEALAPSPWPPAWIAVLEKVRVEDLLVERFSLEERLLGESAVLRAEGWLKSSPHEQEASMTATRIDRKGTSLDARAVLKNGRLALDVRVHDQGDLLARAIGLEGPLGVSLQGEGELEHWEGSVIAHAEAYGELKSDVVLEADRDVTVKAAGSLHLRQESLSPALSHWIRGETPFHLEAVMTKETLTVRRFALNRDDVGFTLAGSMNLHSGNVDGRFTLNCSNLESLSNTIHRRVDGTFLAQGNFSGMIYHPVMSADVKIDNFRLDDSEFSSLQGNLRVTFLDQTRTEPLRLQVQGNGDLRNLKLRSFYEEHVLWALDLTGPLKNHVLINEFEFRGKSLSLRATGELGIKEPLSFALHLRGKWALPLSLSSLEPFLGKAVDYEGQTLLEGGQRLSVSQASLETSTARLVGNGIFNLHENVLNSSWDLTVPHLQSLATALGYPVEGSTRISGTMDGPLERLTLKAEAIGKDLSFLGLPIAAAKLNLLAHGVPQKTQGLVSLAVIQSAQSMKSQADFVMDQGRISFTNVTLEGPETRGTGLLEVEMETGRVTGRMNGECRDLSALSPWLGEVVEGRAVLDTDFVLGGTGATVSLALEAADLSMSYGKARQIRIQAQVTEPTTAPRGLLSLDLTEARLGGWSLTSSAIQMEGDFDETRFQSFVKGHGPEAFEFESSGSFSLHRRYIKWETLKGYYHKTPVRLASPLFIETESEGYSVQGLSIIVGTGLVDGGGRMEKNGMDFLLNFQGVALDSLSSQLSLPLAGILSGRLALRGTHARPIATFEIRASGLKTEELRLKGLPPLILEAKGDFQEQRLTANLSLKGLTSKPFEARLILPLDFSLSPFALSVPTQAPLRGSFAGEMNLERLAGLLDLDDQIMGGQGNLELQCEGTMEAPGIRGHIRMNDGAYENLRTGTVLSQIQIDISARSPRLQIVETRAADGENGVISAEGWLDIAPKQGFPLNVVLRLDRAKLFRYDAAVATVSGTLSLEGSLREAGLSGRINVDSSEFRIPDRLPDVIREVEVVEINKKETVGPPSKSRGKKGAPWPLNLDVVVVSPGRTFVRGRGLDTEWEGQIRVSGIASQPSATGTVSVVRGKADFLGKSFNVKRGTIAFGGSFPPAPFIDVTAEATAKDVTVQLSIIGILPSPEIKLSSQPLLPTDEILARLLFGRSSKNLTPVQAFQLADALNTLSGGGLDLLGRSRRLLGVDQLGVKNTDEKLEDAAISAGKYITEDVYIEVEKGISPETGKASVKWDVTPNVTVDTEVGVNAEAGVGVQWKWDY